MSNVQDLVEVFYIRQYALLKCFGAWELPEEASPRINFLYRMYFWYFLLFWLLLFDIGMIMKLIVNIDNVEEIINVLCILATGTAVMGKYLHVKKHSEHFDHLFRSLHTREFLPRNREEKKMFVATVKLSRKVRNAYASLSLVALSGLLFSQFIREEKPLPAPIFIPMALDTLPKYILMYIYQALSMCVLCFVNIAFDSLASSFLINVKGQLDMLAFRLENIGRGAALTQEEICLQLKHCIVYYQRILEMCKLIEYLVSIPVSIQIACSVFVLIANFYSMSLLSGTEELGNFITFLMYQICMLAQFFILCYFANEISLKSSDISFRLYCSDWYHWNKVNRKMVLLMMLRFETPIRINSINTCYSFNLAAFTSIVNSSYSYFALLKQINS